MIRTVRAAALRSTALATCLALAAALSIPADAAPKVPLPKPRPIARNSVVATEAPGAAPATTATTSAAPKAADKNGLPVPLQTAHAPAAAPLGPPPRAPSISTRKPITPAAVAATSSTSQADKDALENVIELLRKRKPDDATQAEAAISDPVARKLAEWLILRSDSNNVTVERYRAFISANPSWPSQTFLRRRLEAALWDDKREDAAIWSWFENESPISAKGRLALAKVMIGRGDRNNAERLVRDAWRSDPMSEDTESTALDMFGAFLTAGDHKARMDSLLYGTENEAAGTRAAKRLGSGHVALAKARIAANRKGGNLNALLDAVPHELRSDPGYTFAKIQSLRRDEKFAEAAKLMMSAPKDPGRLHNLDEWWIERRLLARKMIDTSEFRTAYLIARDAALPAQGHLQDRAGIHRRLDRAALPQRSLPRRAAFRPHRRRQRQSDRAGTRRLLARARRGGRRPRPGSARRLYPRRRAIDQLLRPAGAGQTRPAADRAERHALGPRPQSGTAGDRARGATALRNRRGRARNSPARRHGRERRSRGAGRARRVDRARQRRPRHAVDGQGRAQPRPAVRFLRLSRQRNSRLQADRPRSRAQHRLRHRPPGKRLQSRRWFRLPRPTG